MSSKTKETKTWKPWTDAEIELLLEVVKKYASQSLYKGIDWEGVKTKYEKITEMFIERYPIIDGEEQNEDYPRSNEINEITKQRVAAKLKAIRQNFKKAIDCGKRSGGGRVVMTFYDICYNIWADAPSTKSIHGAHDGIDSSAFDGNTNKLDHSVLCDTDDENKPLSVETDLEEQICGNQVQDGSNRREKIAVFLKDEKERRITPKQSLNKQYLHVAKEDMALKSKMMENSERNDQEILNNTAKMIKTMKHVGEAITNCFDLMKKMFERNQHGPVQSIMQTSLQPSMQYGSSVSSGYQDSPYGFNHYYPYDCFNTSTFIQQNRNGDEQKQYFFCYLRGTMCHCDNDI